VTTLDSLLAVSIHDAKNQLAALNTWLEVVHREHPSPALDHALGIADEVAAGLVALLALYREGEGHLRLSIDDRNLRDFCDDLFAALRLPAGHVVRIERGAAEVAAERIGAWAFDAYLVRMVLLDALRNAVRHARTTVRFALTREAGGICFTVADDGEGFPAPLLDGGDGVMGQGGSGLGLRFARLIAMRHATPDGRHGRVELANAAGAVFRLILP